MVDMIAECFPHIEQFDHHELFEGARYPWEALDRLSEYMNGWFQKSAPQSHDQNQNLLQGATFHKIMGKDEGDVQSVMVVQYPLRTQQALFLEPWKIFIGQGTLLESGVMIKSPAIIGHHCEVRHGAYLRGNVILGNRCVAGHVTEIKNSIFMDDACAGHFAYVGDSILGNDANLGAGTKLANLEFRTPEEKKSRNIRLIVIKCVEQKINTGRKKLGAVIGDCVETGCNSVLAPGTILGRNSWVLPNVFVKKNYYAPDSRIK